MRTGSFLEEYSRAYGLSLDDLDDFKYADHTFTTRDVKSMVKQLGIQAVLNEIDDEELEMYLRKKKLNKIKEKIKK